jgi:transglutaminase-like putative cysteine protease
MKRHLVFCFLAWVIALPLRAQELSYHTGLIPKLLQANANAVVRFQESSIEVKALDQVVYKYREAITILNPQGAEYGKITVFYDKSRQIKSLKAAVYDQQGQLIKKAGTGDFQDVSAISDFSLFEDNRVKYYDPLVSHYPFTVVYEYELRIKHTFYFPEWEPQRAADIAVQAGTYRFTAKSGFALRLKEYNLALPRQQTQTADAQLLHWQVQDLPALRPEPYSRSSEDNTTRVLVAPVEFAYEGLSGRFSDWKSYGQWAFDHMIKGRSQLPPATVEQVQQLVQGSDSPREQVRKIYEYAQQKNRYISVQIGIGGLQPMKAEEVDRLRYGDCKALTNYTMALLGVAGIPALYTEVHAGNRKKDYLPDFASAFQGNHAILCVPMAQDTIWLECTSREAPMGYLGSFTDGRRVLLYTEQGGVLARTKAYPASQNSQRRTARLHLQAEGSLSGQVETRFEGTQYDNREALILLPPKEQREALKKAYPINNLEILNLELKQQKTEQPTTIEKLDIQVNHFGTRNNNLLFVPINQLNREISAPREMRNRKNKVYVSRGFADEDDIRYVLPPDFKPEYLPPALLLENEFGYFSVKVQVQGNELHYTRKLVLNQGEYAPEAYERFYTFLKKIADADQEKFVLARK